MAKIAYVDELAFTKRHGGSSAATVQLSKYMHEMEAFETEIFSFSNGIETKIPNKIKFLPNIREILLPFVGNKLIPKLEKHFDLIHFSSTTTPSFYKSCVPTVLTTHCIFSRQTKILSELLPLRYSLIFNELSYSMFKELERNSFENVDRIIAPKNDLKRFLVDKLSISPNKISIVPQGIDIELFKQKDIQTEKENLVLFVGRGTIAKGFDTLIAASDLIDANVVAVVPHISQLYRRIAKTKRNVTLITKRLNHIELNELYQKVRVFVMPSLVETGPLVTLEAMACGLPVVCTQEGGGDFVKDKANGFIVPFRDPASLAEKINHILHDTDIERKFGEESRKQSEYFSIKNAGEKTRKIYESLIS